MVISYQLKLLVVAQRKILLLTLAPEVSYAVNTIETQKAIG